MPAHVRLRMAALAATACAFLLVPWTGPAGAQSLDDPGSKPPASGEGPRGQAPAGFATWDALFAEQERLNGVADQLAEAGEKAQGFGGLVVAPENHEVRLYWRGQVPPAVQTAVEQGRLRAPVRVLSAAHAQDQLAQEAERWVASGQVTGAAPQPDGSGLHLSVVSGDTTPDQLRRPDGATAPITLERADAAEPAYDRQNDVPSYYGGGRTKNWNTGGGCTAGFPVVDRNGYEGFLTAAHCGELWHDFYDGGGTSDPANYMGRLNWRIANRDAAIVNADTHGRMFTGGVNSSYSARVVGVFKSYPGNYVCNSGSKTGEICYIKVTHYGWSGTYTNGQYVKHMIRAKHIDGHCAGAKGDSGGPIFAYAYTNNWDAVKAHGVMSAFSGSVYCGGAVGGPVIVFPRVWDVLLAFEAALLVS
ncbi:hypothetical protein [Sphaerisporangium sp. TRM90804]|uniref:hypothetical protein n=1 Tax=Sphaerisporangium sp. TRM90804 TaxID=3031113 RepID=UPI00244CED7C|nr:hypothetical protein [Sphaerisporangium sp. TRM90804]MDH2426109.1 hypothetical protein [Sphaerisporangium sp. TRM90804]